MKGGNVNIFIDHTTFEECAVIYKGVKYFFHGLIYDNEKEEYSYVIDVWDSNGNYERTVFDKTASTSEECLKLAQNNPFLTVNLFGKPNRIWNGLSGN